MTLQGFGARTAAAFAALTLAACASSEPAGETEAKPPAELRAFVDRTVATTGDLISWTVEVEREPEVDVEFDDPGAEVAGFRLVDLGRSPVETLASGRLLERRRYEFRADLVGSWVLPALTATYSEPSGPGGDLAAAEISVEVESVLPDDRSEATDIRDIKPPRRDDGAWWPPWTGLALAVAALGLAVWWLRRRRQPAGGEPEAAPVPPWDLAMRELKRLRGADLSDPRELRRYYFAVSSVVRAYVEGRYGLNATDLTTEEILARLGGLARLEPLQARRLERFLVATDQVKFAAHLPAAEEIERTYEQALAFVTATRPEDDPEDGESAAPASDRTEEAA